MALLPGSLGLLLVVLMLSGLIRIYTAPTAAMAPTIMRGDSIIMEGFTFWGRKPKRGDIVAFKTDGIGGYVPAGLIYLKRIIGEPGEHLRIVDGKLFINSRLEPVRIGSGPTSIMSPVSAGGTTTPPTDLVIPPGQYFVIGDATGNSYDSRHFGPIPAKNIKGRVIFRCKPLDQIGPLR